MKTVIPCQQVDEARRLAANHSAGAAVNNGVLLGGERLGKRIEGFDLDNSPLQYTKQAVANKTIVFTTTNGTQALLRSARAERILVGAFANINAVIQTLLADDRPIHLVCAGTRGQVTAEDGLCAGAMASAICSACEQPEWSNDQSRMMMDFFAARSSSQELFMKSMRQSTGGRNLIDQGFDADIRRAAVWDLFDMVPEYSPESGKIQATVNSQPIKRRWIDEPANEPVQPDGENQLRENVNNE